MLNAKYKISINNNLLIKIMFWDFFSKNLYYPIIWKILNPDNIDVARIYKKRLKQSWLPANELKKIQLDRFKKLLIVALKTAYYRPILNNIGLKANEDIKNIKAISDVLPKIPFLTKKLIRERRQEMLNPDAKKVKNAWGGGSTGDPLLFYSDINYRKNTSAIAMLSNTIQKCSPHSRKAMLWGAPIDLNTAKNFIGKLRSRCNNTIWLNSTKMTPLLMNRYHSILTKYQPECIIAYAQSIYNFANYLKSNKIKTNYPSKSIICGAEVLNPKMRNVVKSVFGVEIFDRYGSRDAGCIASECNHHQGLHIHTYESIVECLSQKTGKPIWNKPGELAITNLSNYGQPMLRYRLGDLGILSKQKCSCGRETPLLKQVIGRTCDTITTINGDIVHSAYFIDLFYDTPEVKHYQLVQEDIKHFELKIVKGIKFSEYTQIVIEKKLRKVLGENVIINFEYVNKLNPSPSGKFRYIISKIPVDFQNK